MRPPKEQKLVRILSTFLLFSTAALALPGQPTFLQVGTLSCAARMYTPTQLQVWCFSDPILKVIQINILNNISGGIGLELKTSDGDCNGTCTSVVWLFLPTVYPPNIPPTIPPPPPVVGWQAVITRNGVVGPVLSGVL